MSICKNMYYKIESVRLWYFFDDGSYIELVSKELNYLVAILYVYAGGLNFMKYFFFIIFQKENGNTFTHFISFL